MRGARAVPRVRAPHPRAPRDVGRDERGPAAGPAPGPRPRGRSPAGRGAKTGGAPPRPSAGAAPGLPQEGRRPAAPPPFSSGGSLRSARSIRDTRERTTAMGRIDDRLAELGIELPPPAAPLATYV